MIEIVCPSCDARYQLPDGSVGPNGRNVSCSSCAHKWRAYADGEEPLVMQEAVPEAGAEASEAAPAQEAAPVAQEAAMSEPPAAPPPSPEAPAAVKETVSEAAPEVTTAPAPAAEEKTEEDRTAIAAALAAAGGTGSPSPSSAPASASGTAASPPPAAGDREEQMDAIRKMLSDLKEGADAAADAEPEPSPKPEPETPQVVRKRSEDEDDSDSLKSRIDDLTKLGKAAKGEAALTGYDTQKLRKLHEKRAKRMQKARERRKKSGAFITGFTFVGVIALTMMGLYVMKPQIVAASPGMAPAMDEYVVAVDRYRVDLNAKTVELRAWLEERIGKMKDEEGAEQQQ